MILISGYYGFDNLGDEAILATVCEDLLALGVPSEEIVVLSNNPQMTAGQLGVRALPRYDLRQIWNKMGTARLFLSGGGSLLQDVTSKRSIPYYLGLVELAHLRGVPVVMYGQGLGPVRSGFFRSWIARAFKRSLACSVRNEGSLQFLVDLGVPAEKIQLCADPVFQHGLVEDLGPKSRRILFNLRPYEGWEWQQDLWLHQSRYWQDQGFTVEFLPLGPGDLEMGQALQERCSDLKVHQGVTLETLGQVFSGASLFVSMRLHGLIFSALHDCQPLGLNYDPKVAAISEQLQIPCFELEDVGDLALGVDRVLQNADQHRLDYRKALEVVRISALKNRAMLARVVVR
ncbi:MAG: polysaccharide pyruvyl transferase CsaB [Limnochordia bacterium]|nr:polysaccharide pyruvyl transferase CsaB [Limnochordia bacterium]